MQTGFQFARDNGFDLAVQLDGDGQHDPRELPRLVEPILAGEADTGVGTRFVAGGGYRAARAASGSTSSRRSSRARPAARDRHDVGLPGAEPQGDPSLRGRVPARLPGGRGDGDAIRHRLRLVEVPVAMRDRETGSSSITALRSVYYMVKVLLALFIGLFRRRRRPAEDMDEP